MNEFWQSELRNAGWLSALVLTVLGVAEWWSRSGRAKPEWTRKLVHVGGGLVCLSFPFFLVSPYTVLVMAIGLAVIFACGARWQWLTCLHRVVRTTYGSEYYPLAVALVFLLTLGQPWLYVCALLVLAVADAFAALVGGRYGRVRYEVDGNHKSLEGSLVFLLISFLAMYLPLTLMTELPRTTCALAAALVAMLVTGFEAVSLRGTDNLFVPLGVCVILGKITTKPVAEILYQNVSLATLCVSVGLLAWRVRSLNVGGTLVIIMFTYAAWSLGSELWALPVLLSFVAYMALWWLPSANGRAELLKVRAVFRAVVMPLLLLVVGNSLGWMGTLFAPFVAAMGTVLALASWNHVTRIRLMPAGAYAGLAVGFGTGAGAIVTLGPWWALGWPAWSGAAAIGVAITAASWLHCICMTPQPKLAKDDRWPAADITLTGLAALLVLAAQGLGWAKAWSW